jgi:hypothetical protein
MDTRAMVAAARKLAVPDLRLAMRWCNVGKTPSSVASASPVDFDFRCWMIRSAVGSYEAPSGGLLAPDFQVHPIE